MKTTPEAAALQQAVMLCLNTKLQQANLVLSENYPRPAVLYNQRGTLAGKADLNAWVIYLNPVLLMENQQTFIDEVVPHELAHLLVHRRFGKVPPHGKEWCWMMEQVLAVPANRTHRFSVDSVRRTVPYRCACQQHELTIRRHYRILREQSQYRCRRCGEPLQPGMFQERV